MKQFRLGLGVFLGLALLVTGCAKKSADQTSISGSGFDTLSSTTEVSQIAQPPINISPSVNQQGSIEVLPIETSPVTQGVSAAPVASASETLVGTTETALSHQKKIQTALKNAGLYNGAIDGKIGPASREAIKTFQKNNGLKADGKVGPKTWTALEVHVNGAPVSSSASSSESTQATSGN